MTIHSVAMPAHAASRRRADAHPAPKRDAILRAAIDVFAERGFFNAQVADVARSAGVAAGTVYLYFSSKDDLLVSIFERTMREAFTEGRAAVAGIHDPSERLRVRPGASGPIGATHMRCLPGGTAPVNQLMDTLSTLLRDYLANIRPQSGGTAEGASARMTNLVARCLRRARRNGTNWIRAPRYSLEADADLVSTSSDRPGASASIPRFAPGGARRGHHGCADRAQLANAGVRPCSSSYRGDRRDGMSARSDSSRTRSYDRRHGVITVGGFESDFAAREVDWIIEAVVSRSTSKRGSRRIDAVRRPDTLRHQTRRDSHSRPCRGKNHGLKKH